MSAINIGLISFFPSVTVHPLVNLLCSANLEPNRPNKKCIHLFIQISSTKMLNKIVHSIRSCLMTSIQCFSYANHLLSTSSRCNRAGIILPQPRNVFFLVLSSHRRRSTARFSQENIILSSCHSSLPQET